MGSEMCIRDSIRAAGGEAGPRRPRAPLAPRHADGLARRAIDALRSIIGRRESERRCCEALSREAGATLKRGLICCGKPESDAHRAKWSLARETAIRARVIVLQHFIDALLHDTAFHTTTPPGPSSLRSTKLGRCGSRLAQAKRASTHAARSHFHHINEQKGVVRARGSLKRLSG